jgi:aminopeptidase N
VARVAAVLLAPVLALSAAPADAALPAGSPGAAGIGDPYFPKDGNGGYQVRHYDIHDTYRVHSRRLHGWTVVTAVAKKRLSRFHLDLVLTPDSVRVDGRTARFRKPSRHELVVTPRRTLRKGEHFRVRVRYHGFPERIGYAGSAPWISGPREALAMNEPQIAPWWFPANDHPSDKATFDITMRVRKGQQLVSNGTRVSRRVHDGWTRTHWRVRQPMATYLAFFAVGRFRVERGVRNRLRYTYAVSKGLSAPHERQAMRMLRRTTRIVRWLEGQFGPYPFASTGGVVTALSPGFALENQTRPTYPFLGDGRYATSTVVHEQAHQWFGDDVSVARWRDIWLNEGFATFAEWKYAETHGGVSAQRRLLRLYRSIDRRDGFWNVKIGSPGRNRIFDDAVYVRGGMTLQALRHRIGRADFDRLMRTWVRRQGGGNATVGQFQRLAGQVSGERLGGFFHAWLHSGRKPARTAANGLR